MKFFITLILLISLNTIKACECVDFEYSGKHVRHFFNWYDKVFIGNLIENNQGVYKFEVIQGFKNCEFRDTLWGKYNNSCSITPNEEGLWIVYASIRDSSLNEIDIEACNSTRNLNSNRQYLYDDYDMNSMSYKLKREQSEKIVEIEILNELKEKEEPQRYKKGNYEFQNSVSDSNIRTENNWISILAIILSVIAIIMNIQKRKPAENNV